VWRGDSIVKPDLTSSHVLRHRERLVAPHRTGPFVTTSRRARRRRQGNRAGKTRSW
jgi:hypothetical protein